jgi:hypothetical protein
VHSVRSNPEIKLKPRAIPSLPPRALAMILACVAATGGATALLIPATAVAGEIHAKIVDQAGKPVEDAVVVAKPASGTPTPAKPAEEIVDQIDKEFVPYVKPILVGSYVNFPNKDNIRHHVYSFSPAKRFELPLYSGKPAKPELFDKTGVVVLGCDIHDWMIGYIYVSESPYFAKTPADGRIAIKDLPAGAYSVRIWHPRMKAAEETTLRSATLTASGTADLDWQIELNPDTRVRRAPAAGAARYH